jgi:hypothetical protein
VSKGTPNALLFSLPPGVRNISLSKGFDGYQVIQVDHGFATDAALPPGNTEFAFSFEIPYNSSTYNFAYEALYPIVDFSLMVSIAMHATSAGLNPQGVITADQHPYSLFKASQLLTNQKVSVNLEGLQRSATASAPSPLNTNTIWLIAILLLMLVVVAITWFIYRSNRRRMASKHQKRRGQPQKGTTATAKATKNATTAAEERQQALLQELLDLDKAFESGKMSKTVYQERRTKTKARIRSFMREEEATRR